MYSSTGSGVALPVLEYSNTADEPSVAREHPGGSEYPSLS